MFLVSKCCRVSCILKRFFQRGLSWKPKVHGVCHGPQAGEQGNSMVLLLYQKVRGFLFVCICITLVKGSDLC